MSIPQQKIVFFGTPEFARIILERLIESPYKPSVVITAPDKPVGRKQTLDSGPVKSLAIENNIEIIQPEKLNSSLADNLKPNTYELFIVAAYGKIIPSRILNIPQRGTINIHPSLLPAYRGPSPLQTALLNGDEMTGVSLILLDEELDHGPILAQCELPITQNDNTLTLFDKAAHAGAELLVQTIPRWYEDKITIRTQNHDEATFSKMITREDGHVDWSKFAQEIERMLRALTPWPGLFTFWKDRRLKILSLTAETQKKTGPGRAQVGTVVGDGGIFRIQTGDGFVIVRTVQLEGKTLQTAREFLRTYPEIIGSPLS